jgi:GR25 family glycosyltransferase involved in LPS biosynthesis
MNYKTFIVNLKKREDRKKYMIDLLNNIGYTNYEFFEAIDGKNMKPTLELIHLFAEKNNFGNRKAMIGCSLSHYNIWLQLLKDKKIDYFVVFEDDITLSPRFVEGFLKITDYLNIKENMEKVDLLNMGYSEFVKDNIYNSDFVIQKLTITKNYVGGTFGYIITRSGAQKLINHIEKNQIKSGIDTEMIHSNVLNMYEIYPQIVYSEWVRTNNSSIDSDIQNDYISFDFDQIYDYYNLLYIKGKDIVNHDIQYNHSFKNTKDLIKIANSNEECHGFNTLGFFKSNIDMKELTETYWINSNTNHGIFIKLDRKYTVKLLCNWCSSEDLCNEWDIMSKGNNTWNNIQITSDNNHNKIDFYIIINKPLNENEFYVPSKTIVFQMEPRCLHDYQNWGVKTWEKWADPDPNVFLEVRQHKNKNHYNNCTWGLNQTYTQLSDPMNKIEKKYHYLSSVCSSQYLDPGQKKRIDFLKYIEKEKEISIDIYGRDNIHRFENYKGSLSPLQKERGIMPYQYYFMAENNREYNYITEKLYEPILAECLTFYWGCPNVEDYLNPMAYVQLDLNNFEGSYQIIKRSIEEDLWSKRIQYIREEKYKILNYYNFFPTVEKIITSHQLKDYMGKLTKKMTIYMIITDERNTYKTFPFINTLKEFGFTIELIKNTSNHLYFYEKIVEEKETTDDHNYLLLLDSYVLKSSYICLLYHMIFLPDFYDVCYLGDHLSNPVKIVDQKNIYYYIVKKYFFKCNSCYIISKRGAKKIIEYSTILFNQKNILPNFHDLFYECYDKIEDFSFYSVQKSLFSKEENNK